jgi:hypothetical protein
MLILWVVGLIEKVLLLHVIFLDLVLFVGPLANSLLSHNPPQSQSMYLLLVVAPRFFGLVHTIRDYGVTYKSVPLMCDNSGAICLAQNTDFHGTTKHIKVRHHFLRDHVDKGDIVIKYIETEGQLTDIFTKPLDASHFATLRGELGVCHPYGLV